jgi:hypothetical protein
MIKHMNDEMLPIFLCMLFKVSRKSTFHLQIAEIF